ncbi:hypothetical protein I7I48_04249 [Histoplasma ohiense]|nr:hypothetical protein I7I48_04249 [Histoplasma ohiense (nom. inval.)]
MIDFLCLAFVLFLHRNLPTLVCCPFCGHSPPGAAGKNTKCPQSPVPRHLKCNIARLAPAMAMLHIDTTRQQSFLFLSCILFICLFYLFVHPDFSLHVRVLFCQQQHNHNQPPPPNLPMLTACLAPPNPYLSSNEK